MALKRRRDAPNLGGVPVRACVAGRAVFATNVGYVQNIDIDALQLWVQDAQVRVVVTALPGTFAAPDRALAYLSDTQGDPDGIDCKPVIDAFEIGVDRRFDDDPRFGLAVLSEIACRALSPAVNDPGTAIKVVGTLLRLFTLWSQPATAEDEHVRVCDRVQVPEVSVRDMFDDAFTATARDGASMVEVSVRLQKALLCLASVGDSEMRDAAGHHGRLALERARIGLDMEEDLAAVWGVARFPDAAAVSDSK